jgi:hypothetical protein
MPMTFDHLFLLGLPASGKSELIDFMKKQSPEELRDMYHLGRFEEMDDFVWLWDKFIEDDLWERVGKGRFFSKRHGGNYGLVDGELFNFLIERFNQEIPKQYLSKPEFYKDGTLLIEFSRGCDYKYADALGNFEPDILNRAAILYIQVKPEESRRRNDARYQEKLRHSILAHKTPDEVMDKFYSFDDWTELTGDRPSGMFTLNGVSVPFVTMNNEPESTDPEVLSGRYGEALNTLWKLKNS